MSPANTRYITLRSILTYTFASIIVLLLVAYAVFQARFLIQGPRISLIDTPQNVEHQRVVTLAGYAQNIVGITLNGRTIYTDKNGYFKEAVVLENGYTIATLRARDMYGRQTKQTRTFVYKPDPLATNQ